MDLIKLTSTHYFGFLYVAFAHLTDGKYTREEQLTIWKIVTKWSKTEITKGEFGRIMDDVMNWYKQKMNEEDFEDEVFDIARRINEYDWFNHEEKIESLKDLKTIALADNNYIKNEKLWVRKIAKIWEIDPKAIKKILAG